MYSNKVCTSLAEMYINWAWELEQAGSTKKADQVFLKGMEKVEGEEDGETLRKARERFHARAAKKAMEKRQDEGQDEEQRAVLGTLRGTGKKQKVGSVRVGAAKKSDDPGRMPQVEAAAKVATNTSRPFAVYQVRKNRPLLTSLLLRVKLIIPLLRIAILPLRTRPTPASLR